MDPVPHRPGRTGGPPASRRRGLSGIVGSASPQGRAVGGIVGRGPTPEQGGRPDREHRGTHATRDRTGGQGSVGLRLDRAGPAAHRGGRWVLQRRLRALVPLLREFEAARTTMARINQCAICIDWRTARDVPSRAADPGEVPEAFYEAVGVRGDWSGLSEREPWPPSSPSATPRTTWAWTTPSGPGCTTPTATTSWSTWPCAWARGWPSAASTRSSTSTAPAGSPRPDPR